MKKKLFYLIILILTTASCGSVVRVNREQVSAPIIYATRDDISITDDLTSTGKVKTVSVLFVNFYRWNEDKRQLKIGPFRFLDRNYEEGVFNIYKTNRVNGKWTLPQKVTVFNSKFDDLSVIFKTERTGFLNTFRYDNTDNIYYFELKY